MALLLDIKYLIIIGTLLNFICFSSGSFQTVNRYFILF